MVRFTVFCLELKCTEVDDTAGQGESTVYLLKRVV